MKNVLTVAFFGAAIIMVAATEHYNSNAFQREASACRLQSEILRDQLADMIYQQRSVRTYEEGVRDGLANANNSDFTRGYHLGISQKVETIPIESISKME